MSGRRGVDVDVQGRAAAGHGHEVPGAVGEGRRAVDGVAQPSAAVVADQGHQLSAFVVAPSMPTMTSMTGLLLVLDRSEKMPPCASVVLTHAE